MGGINLDMALLPLAHDPQSIVMVGTPILWRQWSPVQIMVQPFFWTPSPSSLHPPPPPSAPSPPSQCFVYSSAATPTSRNIYVLFLFLFPLSPWYNRNGWLGVKHQVTRVCLCVNSHIKNGTAGPSGYFTGNEQLAQVGISLVLEQLAQVGISLVMEQLAQVGISLVMLLIQAALGQKYRNLEKEAGVLSSAMQK